MLAIAMSFELLPVAQFSSLDELMAAFKSQFIGALFRYARSILFWTCPLKPYVSILFLTYGSLCILLAKTPNEY